MSDDDPVLDVCLEEVLGGCSPPDLTQRILKALREAEAPVDPVVRAEGSVHVIGRRPGKNGTSSPRSRKRRKPPAPTLNLDGITVDAPPVQAPVVRDSSRATTKKATASARKERTTIWTINWCLAGVAVALIAFSIITRVGPSRRDTVVNESTPTPSRSRSMARRHREPPRSRDEDGVRQPANDGLADTGETGSGGGANEPGTSLDPPHGLATTSDSSVPYRRRPSYEVPEKQEDRVVVANVDHWMRELWKADEVQPSPAAPDEEWVRRLYLRILGRVPTVEELAAYQAIDGADRRSRLVAKLLDDPEFSANWASVLTEALVGPPRGDDQRRESSRAGLTRYLQKTLDEDRPWDEVTYELISATGSSDPDDPEHNGATNFLLSSHDESAVSATDRAARVFVGQRLRCVQCHDDHLAHRKLQRHFWEMNAFFQAMRVERDGAFARLFDQDVRGEDAVVSYEDSQGQTHSARPRLLDMPASSGGEFEHAGPRVELATLIAGSENLSLATVNRVWAHFFGYGLVNPVDDMGDHNPPVSEELLDHLAGQFRAADHDLRSLIRWMALSEPFGLSSKVPLNAVADAPYAGRPLFTHYYTRPMRPEQVYDSLQIVANERKSGHRMAQDAQARVAWLQQFHGESGTDQDDSFHDDLRPSVIIMTGPLMQLATNQDRDNVLGRVIAADMTRQEKVDHLFLAAVARAPGGEERKMVDELVKIHDGDEAAALEDIWWALLNSGEFLLDH